MKTNILIDTERNTQLVEQGYTSISCFDPKELWPVLQKILNEADRDEGALKGLQNQLHKITFHSTYADPDMDYKKVVWKHLKPLFEQVLAKNFRGHKIIQTCLFNKPPGAGFMSPHQNLTTVDEERFTSVSIWIPLQDTSTINGTLCLAPKSHGKFEKFRNGDIFWPPLNVTENIEDYGMISLDVKSGDALVFDDSLVHASPINNSAENRLVFHALTIPLEASAIYCHKRENMVDIIEVEDDFWQFNVPGETLPSGRVTRTVPFVKKNYTKESLRDEISP